MTDPISAAWAARQKVDAVARDIAAGRGDYTTAPPPDDHAVEGARLPQNDFGNAQRLVLYAGADCLWVPRLGWFRWDGRRWCPDEDEIEIRRDAQRLGALIAREVDAIALRDWQAEIVAAYRDNAAALDDLESRAGHLSADDVPKLAGLRLAKRKAVAIEEVLAAARKSHKAHAITTGNTNRIRNAIDEARPMVAVKVEDLNPDPWQICCENGVIQIEPGPDPDAPSWRDGMGYVARLLDHDRDQRITKIVHAPYDPAAPCPNWQAFLARVQPDPEQRAFLQRWFGYSLTGSTSEQKLAFFHGKGRNGKSTCVDILARLLGDFSTTLPIETLTGAEQRKGSDATPDLVRLPGARFVRASEPEQGTQLKEALIKQLTGGEPIMIRRMQQEFVEIMPTFKLTISGNHRPEIRGADDGIWRRVLLVPWPVQIPKEDVDPELPAKLWAERAGILAWLIDGMLDWRRGGLRPPDAILSATDDYRRDSNPVREFIESECHVTGNPDHFETGRDLGRAFNAWQLARGFSAFGRRTTALRLKEQSQMFAGPDGKKFEPAKKSDSGYRGILISDPARSRIDDYTLELDRVK